MQFPRKHFSLNAHSLSFTHCGKHMLSRQVYPSKQFKLEVHETGTEYNRKIIDMREYMNNEVHFTSNTFNILVSCKSRWAVTLFYMVDNSAFSIDTACLSLFTRVQTLTLQTLFCWVTLIVRLT